MARAEKYREVGSPEMKVMRENGTQSQKCDSGALKDGWQKCWFFSFFSSIWAWINSGYIGIGYTVFSAITAIFLLNFWSQNQFHTLKYFGFTGISHLPAILARTNVVDVTGIECNFQLVVKLCFLWCSCCLCLWRSTKFRALLISWPETIHFLIHFMFQ